MFYLHSHLFTKGLKTTIEKDCCSIDHGIVKYIDKK